MYGDSIYYCARCGDRAEVRIDQATGEGHPQGIVKCPRPGCDGGTEDYEILLEQLGDPSTNPCPKFVLVRPPSKSETGSKSQ